MAPRGTRYTKLGKKVAYLAANQAELAQVLNLTQQSISGKLTGKIAVTLKDLELLSRHYEVPLIYFVASREVTPELARAWEKILEGHPELRQTMELAADFTPPFVRQLLQIVRSMHNTASYYAEQWQRDARREHPGPTPAEPERPVPDPH